MSTAFSANVLADSISPAGVRLTTFEVVHPRFLLAEFNTHKMVSKNSASSRAKKTEDLIDQVQLTPFVPETFNERVKGMGIGAALDDTKQKESRRAWLRAKEHAVAGARILMELGVDKSRANRLLEPFMWHTAIYTATDWDNFFALRCPPGDPDPDFPAQIEFQIAAVAMREAMAASAPRDLDLGFWHLPLITDDELKSLCAIRMAASWGSEGADVERDAEIEFWKMVSAGRCARVSYDTHHNFESTDKSLARAVSLINSGHMSPFEHIARPIQNNDFTDDDRCKKLLIPGDVMWDIAHQWVNDRLVDFPTERVYTGNLRGFWQMRKGIPHEENHRLAVAAQENS